MPTPARRHAYSVAPNCVADAGPTPSRHRSRSRRRRRSPANRRPPVRGADAAPRRTHVEADAVPSPGPTRPGAGADGRPDDLLRLLPGEGGRPRPSSRSGTYTIQTDTNDDRKHCTVIGGALSIQGARGLPHPTRQARDSAPPAAPCPYKPAANRSRLAERLEFVGGDLVIENNANDLDTLEVQTTVVHRWELIPENWLPLRRRDHALFPVRFIGKLGQLNRQVLSELH